MNTAVEIFHKIKSDPDIHTILTDFWNNLIHRDLAVPVIGFGVGHVTGADIFATLAFIGLFVKISRDIIGMLRELISLLTETKTYRNITKESADGRPSQETKGQVKKPTIRATAAKGRRKP